MIVRVQHVWAGFIGMGILSFPLFGATVKSVKSKSKSVVLELTEDDALEKGMEICVFDDSDQKIDCGTISKLKGKRATLKFLSKKKLKKIKPGFMARSPDAPVPSGSSSQKWRIFTHYVLAASAPTTFNKISYNASGTDSKWKSDGASSLAFLGFSGQVGIPVGGMSLSPGLRFRMYTTSQILSDLTAGVENPYAFTEIKATSFGFFTDLYFYQTSVSSVVTFNLGAGLDIDSSNVTLTATRKHDTDKSQEGPLAKVTSKANVISLRLPANLDLAFTSSFAANVGLNLLVPLTATGLTTKAEMTERGNREQKAADDDLAKALGHNKNSFGAEIIIGLGFMF